MHMSNQNNYVIWGLAIVAIIGGFLIWQQRSIQSPQTEGINSYSAQKIEPVTTLSHGHGLAVDVTNPDIVYIATHEGLLMLSGDKQLYRIGDSLDDLMGFTAHPTESSIFFSSGHPHAGGGNLGFQRSDNGGINWQKISPGVNGPVDFHAMTISSVNPNLLYGWYYNALQRSRDQGKTWEIVPTSLSQVISLVADTTDEKTIYASTGQGIQVSVDEGATWSTLPSENLGAVTTLAIHPQQSDTMLSFSENLGLVRSSDGGKTWRTINASIGNHPLMFIAFSKTDPKKVYTYTHGSELYVSEDEGVTWVKIK